MKNRSENQNDFPVGKRFSGQDSPLFDFPVKKAGKKAVFKEGLTLHGLAFTILLTALFTVIGVGAVMFAAGVGIVALGMLFMAYPIPTFLGGAMLITLYLVALSVAKEAQNK